MYFSFFKPPDWRKRSVVRGRGFRGSQGKMALTQREKVRCPGALAVGRIHPMCGQSAVFSVITVS